MQHTAPAVRRPDPVRADLLAGAHRGYGENLFDYPGTPHHRLGHQPRQ